MSIITVVVADDHPIVRHGLSALLENEAYIRVVGEADDRRATVELVERLQPAIAVVDLMMPGLDGLEVTRRLRRAVPRTRVIMLSMYLDSSQCFGITGPVP